MADAGDFYRFTTAGTGTTAHRIVLNFTHSQGDLDFILYNSAGTHLEFLRVLRIAKRFRYRVLPQGHTQFACTVIASDEPCLQSGIYVAWFDDTASHDG